MESLVFDLTNALKNASNHSRNASKNSSKLFLKQNKNNKSIIKKSRLKNGTKFKTKLDKNANAAINNSCATTTTSSSALKQHQHRSSTKANYHHKHKRHNSLTSARSSSSLNRQKLNPIANSLNANSCSNQNKSSISLARKHNKIMNLLLAARASITQLVDLPATKPSTLDPNESNNNNSNNVGNMTSANFETNNNSFNIENLVRIRKSSSLNKLKLNCSPQNSSNAKNAAKSQTSHKLKVYKIQKVYRFHTNYRLHCTRLRRLQKRKSKQNRLSPAHLNNNSQRSEQPTAMIVANPGSAGNASSSLPTSSSSKSSSSSSSSSSQLSTSMSSNDSSSSFYNSLSDSDFDSSSSTFSLSTSSSSLGDCYNVADLDLNSETEPKLTKNINEKKLADASSKSNETKRRMLLSKKERHKMSKLRRKPPMSSGAGEKTAALNFSQNNFVNMNSLKRKRSHLFSSSNLKSKKLNIKTREKSDDEEIGDESNENSFYSEENNTTASDLDLDHSNEDCDDETQRNNAALNSSRFNYSSENLACSQTSSSKLNLSGSNLIFQQSVACENVDKEGGNKEQEDADDEHSDWHSSSNESGFCCNHEDHSFTNFKENEAKKLQINLLPWWENGEEINELELENTKNRKKSNSKMSNYEKLNVECANTRKISSTTTTTTTKTQTASQNENSFEDLFSSAFNLMSKSSKLSYLNRTRFKNRKKRYNSLNTDEINIATKSSSNLNDLILDFKPVNGDPIPETNKGNKMLQNMGWKPGTSLGAQKSDSSSSFKSANSHLIGPIIAVKRPNKLGLGFNFLSQNKTN